MYNLLNGSHFSEFLKKIFIIAFIRDEKIEFLKHGIAVKTFAIYFRTVRKQYFFFLPL